MRMEFETPLLISTQYISQTELSAGHPQHSALSVYPSTFTMTMSLQSKEETNSQ